MNPDPAHRYTAVAIFLHWFIALAIISMIFFGWYMGDVEDDATRYALTQLHKSFGIVILFASVARIVWRLMNKPPEEPPMPPWQNWAAQGVHIAFYALIVLMPLSGWIMVSASTTGIDTMLFKTIPWPHLPGLPNLSHDAKEAIHEPIEFVHSKLAWVALGLLALHVIGALKHQFIEGDNLLARMIPGVFGRTLGPTTPPRGYLLAFGAAAALFIIAAGTAMISNSSSAQITSPEGASTANQSAAPFWDVDLSQSAIAFTSGYSGRPFNGVFENWTPTIQFDPADLAETRIRVEIELKSVNTGEPYYDESVVDGDWFNARNFPIATFEVDGDVEETGAGAYTAAGTLSIRDQTHPITLPFTLDIQGDTATVKGEVTLQRTALSIGAGTPAVEDGDKEWVADDVVVTINLTATRQ